MTRQQFLARARPPETWKHYSAANSGADPPSKVEDVVSGPLTAEERVEPEGFLAKITPEEEY